MTPPSLRSDAPVVADACTEATWTIMFATSSTLAPQRTIVLGRCAATNAAPA